MYNPSFPPSLLPSFLPSFLHMPFISVQPFLPSFLLFSNRPTLVVVLILLLPSCATKGERYRKSEFSKKYQNSTGEFSKTY
jgi:hypothetical protein